MQILELFFEKIDKLRCATYLQASFEREQDK